MEATRRQLWSRLCRSSATIVAAVILAPAAALAANDGVNVGFVAAFCNYDSTCDPIENHEVCPTDCAAPVEPPAPEEGEERGSSRSRGASREDTRLPAPPTTVIELDLGSASSVWSSPEDRAFSERFSVRVNRSGAVEFSWDTRGVGVVRVLRAEGDQRFPSSPYEGGLVVYEGDANGFEDRAVEPGQTYRYSVFYDSGGGSYGVRNLVVAETAQALSAGWIFDRAASLPPEAYAIGLALAGLSLVPVARGALARL